MKTIKQKTASFTTRILAFLLFSSILLSCKTTQLNHISVPIPAESKCQLFKSEKEAIIVIPGFGNSRKGKRHQKRFFGEKGYDLYIPDYVDRNSYEGTIENFIRFFEENKLGEYKKIHVFSYIIGSWILNSFINDKGIQNISSIVYDRSPLQERAPKVAVDRIPLLGKLYIGNVLNEFSQRPYPPIEKEDVKIGIIVESKATPLIRLFRKTTESYGPIDWHNLDFNQPYDDLIYTRLNHDEMYYSFDEIGADILYFIKNGSFTPDARREAFEWDPYEKCRE